jgi:hypothetical protein
MMHGNKMAPFTLFEAAVDRAGLRDLIGKQGVTIFAPVVRARVCVCVGGGVTPRTTRLTLHV